jgi:tRNA1(Val) A37 N6-methylase TrmN6
MTVPEDGLGPLTCNAFLGGQLRIMQPRSGYRAGVDPVLLAASIAAKPGQTLLDLGCGAGVAALCVAARVPRIRPTGVELQPGYAALARRNAEENGITLEVIEGDIAHMPDELRARQFDHVIANPPYFDRTISTPAENPGREGALGEDTPLDTWLRMAAKRCAPGGQVTVIHRAERLNGLLESASLVLGSLEIKPLIPRRGRPARLVLLRGKKGGRAALKLHDGWLLHEGAEHEADGESYTDATNAILRHGGPLPFS